MTKTAIYLVAISGLVLLILILKLLALAKQEARSIQRKNADHVIQIAFENSFCDVPPNLNQTLEIDEGFSQKSKTNPIYSVICC